VPDTTPYTVPDTINGCAPQPLTFLDPTTGSNSWNWSFGDGESAFIANPNHIYLYPGIYTVNLNTGMAGGCTQNFEPYAIVKIDSFIIDDSQIIQNSDCPPFQFSFSNPTAFVSAYYWSFGDGNTSDLASPTHSYLVSGTYYISLALTMENGCIFYVDDTVTVGYPNPLFVSSNRTCLGDTIIFSLTNPAAFDSITWHFGDSVFSTQFTASHIYDSIGNYYPSAVLIDTIGCLYTYDYLDVITVRDPIPDFTISPNDTACDILNATFNNTSTNALSYDWDFGDGISSTLFSPTHLYNVPGNYNVTLIAKNTGCQRTLTVQNAIVIHSATANFNYTQGSFCLPSGIQFNDSSINAVSWYWDFGDGNTSDQQNPYHTYQEIPWGPVTLSIVDNNGCMASTSQFLNFAITEIYASDTIGCAPLTIDFSSNISNALAWTWFFGDGSSSNSQFPSHTYVNDGDYDVTLVVTYPQGCNDTVTYDDLITVSTATALFNSPTVSVCSPSEVFFVNQSSNATTYLWDFGDGITSTEFEPSHIYNVPGFYTITLIAYSQYGCSDTLTLSNYIEIPGAFAQFNYTPEIGCETFTAHFNDLSINAIAWSWNFGDGSTSAAQHPSHVYSDTGSYVVSLFVADTSNCTSFISLPIQVNFNYFPVAHGVTLDTGGCTPYALSFFDSSSTNTASVIW
ncbi:MAG: PKD domain-containing protein, partial [Bacteroidia bacterium]|nr:PKD domain-containing protein [Bacteroidia bacterium]